MGENAKRPAAHAGACQAGWEARGEAVSNPTNTLGWNTTQEAREVAAEGWPMRCSASGMSWPVVHVLTTVCPWGFELWVFECPYCGGDHLHGGGSRYVHLYGRPQSSQASNDQAESANPLRQLSQSRAAGWCVGHLEGNSSRNRHRSGWDDGRGSGRPHCRGCTRHCVGISSD